MEDSDRIFTEMIRSIERRRSEVTKLIGDQERAEVNRAEELREKLEQEIAELKSRDAELEQLSHTDNHICFLQVLSLLRYYALSQKRLVYLPHFLSHCRVSSLSVPHLQLTTHPDTRSTLICLLMK